MRNSKLIVFAVVAAGAAVGVGAASAGDPTVCDAKSGLGVIDDATLLGVDQEHAPGLQTPLE